MTFRRTALALAAPALSIVLVGCQPPLEEKKDAAGGAPAPATTDAGATTPAVTPAPAPADAKAKPEEAAPTPSPEAPKDAPAEPKADAMPKS